MSTPSPEQKTCADCAHRYWVEAHPYGSSRNGWGCKATGGHAIKVCSLFEAAAPTSHQPAPSDELAGKLEAAIPSLKDAANEMASADVPEGYTELEDTKVADACLQHGFDCMATAVLNWLHDEAFSPAPISSAPDGAGTKEEQQRSMVALLDKGRAHPAYRAEELAELKRDIQDIRETLYLSADRDRDDITTPHLATVVSNALIAARDFARKLEQQCDALKRENAQLLEQLASNDADYNTYSKIQDDNAALRASVESLSREKIETEVILAASQNAVEDLTRQLASVTRDRNELQKDLQRIAEGCGVGCPDREEAIKRIISLPVQLAQAKNELEGVKHDLQMIRDGNENVIREAYKLLGIEDDGELRWKWVMLGISNLTASASSNASDKEREQAYDAAIAVVGEACAIIRKGERPPGKTTFAPT